MIVGTGIDIVEVARIRRSIDRYGDRLLTRVFTDREREYCLGRRYPEIHFAARFAAKEAALKALGTGMSRGIFWRDVEVCRHPSGKPAIEFHNVAADTLAGLGVATVHVSLSHTDGYGAAIVTLETSYTCS